MSLRLAAVPVRHRSRRVDRASRTGFGGDPAGGRDVLAQTLALLTADPRPDSWGCYLADAGDQIVGTCAFNAARDPAGMVEIACMTFPAFERCGYATAMAGALFDIAPPARRWWSRTRSPRRTPRRGPSAAIISLM